MTIRMSEAEARRAGLVPSRSKTTTKSEPRAGARSGCCAPGCDETFTSDAAETRHVEQTGHNRYESETT